MSDLTDIVLAEGAKKGQLALEVLRKGQRETIYVTPEDRPADMPRPQVGNDGAFGGFGPLGEHGIPQELLQRFRGRFPMEFRNFGPGVIIGGGGIGNIPDGVSVSIAKEGDKPAHITVKRGEETWEVSGDDPESLKKLPEDLRPFVEQMLHGASPMDLHSHEFEPGVMPELGNGRLLDRMDRLEKLMQQFMERQQQQEQPAEEATPDEGKAK
jgi:hypothetical protein